MNSTRRTLAAMTVGAFVVALSACQPDEGPMEKAGRNIDNAAERTGEKARDAADATRDAVKGDQR